MPTSKHRINIVLGTRLAAATKKAAVRRGLPQAAFVRSALVERLLNDGDLTRDDLEADEAAEADDDEAAPSKR